MKYIFNSPLLQSLPNILQVTPFKMAKSITSVCHDTLKRGMARGDIRFDTFVEICNEYHLNIHAFFYPAKEQPAAPIILAEADYCEMEFKPELLTHYLNKKQTAWCSDVAEWMSHQRKKKVDLPVSIDENSKPQGNEETQRTNDTSMSRSLDASIPRSVNAPTLIFNLTLLSSLPSILGVERTEIGRVVGRQGNMLLFALRSRDIRMRTLVDICNHYRINIRLFFTEHEYLPMDVIIPEDKWTPITFHPERLLALTQFGTKMELIKRLDYTVQRFQRNVEPATTPMTAQNLIDIIARLQLDISYFFDAPEAAANQRIERQLNATIEQKDATIATKDEQIAQLLKEKRMLESKLRHEQAMRKM